MYLSAALAQPVFFYSLIQDSNNHNFSYKLERILSKFFFHAIKMSSVGQKVTTDPRSQQEVHEAVGVVTSDSLAAESLKGEGSFGEGNSKAAASKQPSKSTTTNTTDTSAASKLSAAPNAGTREAQQEWSQDSELNAGRGLGKDAGRGPTYNTNTSTRAGGATNSDSINGGTGGNASIAPTGGYVGSADGARASEELQPKGRNLKEGEGFEGNEPNASFSNAEIGSADDPGRVAELAFQKRNAHTAGSAAGSTQVGNAEQGTGVYDALKSEERA